MVEFLENSEYAKINRKIHVSNDFRSSNFQNVRGSEERTPNGKGKSSRKTVFFPYYL